MYPTAAKIAIAMALEDLLVEHVELKRAFAAKGREFHDVLKVGRTQLQDAVPMTLGQEFHGFATTLGEDEDRIREVLPLLREINLGATAIGTGITADPRYAATVQAHLTELRGEQYVTAGDLIEATSDTGVFMQMSGVLKRAAVKLSKICNDLRLLSSGPQAGLGEIVLPPRQAGSSIMPGKVNPVIPEVVNQIAFAVVGHDVTVTMAAEAGQLQLNAFEPIILHSILTNVSWLAAGCRTLREHCVEGIRANVDRPRHDGAHLCRRRDRPDALHRLRGGLRAREGRPADRTRRRRPRGGGGADGPGARAAADLARAADQHVPDHRVDRRRRPGHGDHRAGAAERGRLDLTDVAQPPRIASCSGFRTLCATRAS